MGETKKPLFSVSEDVQIRVICSINDIDSRGDNRSIDWQGSSVSVGYDKAEERYTIQSHYCNDSLGATFPDYCLAELATLLTFVEKAKNDFDQVWDSYPHPDSVGNVESYIRTGEGMLR